MVTNGSVGYTKDGYVYALDWRHWKRSHAVVENITGAKIGN